MEIYIPTSHTYVYFPISSDFIKFKVKANFGPHICLSTVPVISSVPYIEFILGLQPSSTSELRIRDTSSLVRHHTVTRENILNGSEFRGFWISFKDGNYKFGCEGETKPLLEWINPNPIEINYFGILSNQDSALWIVGEESKDSSLITPSKFPTWVPASNGLIPPGAISTRGADFIARVKHGQFIIPGRLSSAYKTCYYGVLGKEHNSKEYEVLCGDAGSWAPVTNGEIPKNAFRCSDINSNGKFYIGRGIHDKQFVCGKVYPSDGLCLIPYNGEEHILKDYEIFVTNNFCVEKFIQLKEYA